jgi:hypothetical protein
VLMKRTVRLASLPLNQGKLEALRHVACSYAEAKGVFVGLLRPFSMWHHLEDKRGFRNWAKQQGFYPSGMNVHLVDQAAFDAVDTCVRHIASVVATANMKPGSPGGSRTRTSSTTHMPAWVATKRLALS